MNLHLKILLLLVLISQSIYAQNKPHIISGFIINSETDLSIENVHIQNKTSLTGTVTNNLGYFEIEGFSTDSFKISYISYNTKHICGADLTSYTKRTPSSLVLNEVVLKAQTWHSLN
jgi:hypothetical protein